MPIQVINPDEIPIAPKRFKTRAKAERAIDQWIDRYRIQGYYSAANGERIPLDELRSRLRIEEVTND